MDRRFSEFTRIIGRGPTLSRPLTRAEATDAMTMVLEGQAEPEPLGGFLLVLRQRGETAEELAGFVDAVMSRCDVPAGIASQDISPDIDWPSYADKHQQQPWFILSALLLAENGVRVLMHGIDGATENCAPTRPALHALGIESSRTLADAASQLDQSCFAYIGLEDFAPEAEKLFHLKPLLGVRSVANTFARDINPLNAAAVMVGIVHSPYRPLHQEALRILGQRNAAVFKGVGGEAQRNPLKACTVAMLKNGNSAEEQWSATYSDESYVWRAEERSPDHIADVWTGGCCHPAVEASIIETAALALRTMGRAANCTEAREMATDFWLKHREATGALSIQASA